MSDDDFNECVGCEEEITSDFENDHGKLYYYDEGYVIVADSIDDTAKVLFDNVKKESANRHNKWSVGGQTAELDSFLKDRLAQLDYNADAYMSAVLRSLLYKGFDVWTSCNSWRKDGAEMMNIVDLNRLCGWLGMTYDDVAKLNCKVIRQSVEEAKKNEDAIKAQTKLLKKAIDDSDDISKK